MDDHNEQLLTPGEVAEMFRVEVKTVARWERSGRIGAVRTLGGIGASGAARSSGHYKRRQPAITESAVWACEIALSFPAPELRVAVVGVLRGELPRAGDFARVDVSRSTFAGEVLAVERLVGCDGRECGLLLGGLTIEHVRVGSVVRGESRSA